MAKRKNMKAEKPEFGGCVTFDGNIQVRIPQHGLKTLRTDIGGFGLQKANPNKELLVLTRHHIGYNEIDTGYIVRSKQYDQGEPPYFGLKHEPNAEGWGCHNYCDVIAWGYADGGLNDPTLFYSCQSTVEEEEEREKWRAEHGRKTHAEVLAEMEEEAKKFERPRCFDIKFRHKDGNIETETSWPMKPELMDKVRKYLEPTMENFLDFTEKQPDVKEMHYYTELTHWDADDEPDGNEPGTTEEE